MTAAGGPPGRDERNDEQDPLVAGVRLRRERHLRWLREGDASAVRRLAQIGVLGWIVVVPMLIAVFVGQRVDRALGTGVFWTGPLLVVGLVLGCWSAWRWVKSA